MNNKTKKLTFFSFFTLTASMLMGVYEFPTFATSGANLIFYLIVGGFLWFIPIALVCAELATVKGWNNKGIFTWISQTLGTRFAFASIFYQWFQITVGFVTMMYFVMGAISYVLQNQELNNNPLYKFIGVMILFWTLTITQLKGTNWSAKISKFGFVIGVIIPAITLFTLLTLYIVQGHPIYVDLSPSKIVPDFSKINTLVIFVSFILAYAGAEASSSHVNELENPTKNYPLVMFTLASLAIVVNTIGGLSVAVAVPAHEISLNAGIMQALTMLVTSVAPGMEWIVKVLGLMIITGVMAEVSSWIVGPSRGMYFAAQQNILPSKFAKTNKHDVPVNLLLLQGVIVTIWATILTFGNGSSSNVSFLSAISLTVVIYLLMYTILFIAYFTLIYKHKNLEREYNVPGKMIGKTIIATIGLSVTIFALVISFFPPSSISLTNESTYLTILSTSFIITALLPFVIYHFAEKKGQINIKEEKIIPHDQVNKTVDLKARGIHQIEGE